MKFDLLVIFAISNLANYMINSIDAVKTDEINSKMPNKIMDFQNYWKPRDSNVCEDLKECYRLFFLRSIVYIIFYTDLHELFCPFISWTYWVNSGKFMDNFRISCQVMADMKKACNDLIIINLYSDYDCGKNFNLPHARCIRDPGYIQLIGTLWFFLKTFFKPRHAKPGI